MGSRNLVRSGDEDLASSSSTPDCLRDETSRRDLANQEGYASAMETVSTMHSLSGADALGANLSTPVMDRKDGTSDSSKLSRQKDIHVIATDQLLQTGSPAQPFRESAKIGHQSEEEVEPEQAEPASTTGREAPASGIDQDIALIIAPTRRNALTGLDRRKKRAKQSLLLDEIPEEQGMFSKCRAESTARSEQLRRNGFAGKPSKAFEAIARRQRIRLYLFEYAKSISQFDA